MKNKPYTPKGNPRAVDSTYHKMMPPVEGRIAKEERRTENYKEAQKLAKERRKKVK